MDDRWWWEEEEEDSESEEWLLSLSLLLFFFLPLLLLWSLALTEPRLLEISPGANSRDGSSSSGFSNPILALSPKAGETYLGKLLPRFCEALSEL